MTQLPDDPQPTRAELRRAREAAAAQSVAVPGTPARGRAAPAGSATSTGSASRADRRRAVTRDDGFLAAMRSLLTAWWFYPLIAAIALCVFLAIRSTQTPLAPPGVQVTSPTPAP
jgi:hypothetical protein